MKKQLVSILTAGCLMATMVPAAFAADSSMSEEEFRNAVAEGGTVNLTGDVTLTSTLTIEDGVTINGNGYTITYTPASQTYAVDVRTNDPVKLQNVTVDATAGSMTSGISVQNCVPELTLDDTTLNVMRWGIAFNPTGTGAKLNVQNHSVIQNERVSDYKTEAAYGDYRGISLYDTKAAYINVSDSTIQGFGYTFNLTGTLVGDTRDFAGTVIDVTNSTLMGWTAFNVWSSSTIFNITNSYLKGINNSNGPTDGFATIVVNDDIYGYGWGGTNANEFTITGGTITNYRSGSAPEQLFRIDNQGVTKVAFEYDWDNIEYVKITDGTGDSDSVFYSGHLEDPNRWDDFMSSNVTGADDDNCVLTPAEGQNLVWTPTQAK